jgi:translation initiation factor IF-2
MKRKKISQPKQVPKIGTQVHPQRSLKSYDEKAKKKLDIVLKCDSTGSEEAVVAGLSAIQPPEVDLRVIHSGVGAVTKSDLLLALTAGRLVVGFNVGVAPKIEQLSREQGIEVRLYDVIYTLTKDIQSIANKYMADVEEVEKITGKAKVIALFKSSRKGIILGCEVTEGTLAIGKQFRIISAMGTIFTGQIESLHIEKDRVKEAKPHQQVGLKVIGLQTSSIGDLVECFETTETGRRRTWQPKGGIFKQT